MKIRGFAYFFVIALACWAGAVAAHELGIGDRYYFSDGGVQSVETDELLVSIEHADGYPDDTPHYQVSISSKLTGIQNTVAFHIEGGRMPSLNGFAARDYCGQQVILVTMSSERARYADVFGNLLDTHAFLSRTLEYLDTVFAPVTDIAPLESGVDIGFPYFMPQPYIVDCTAGDGAFELNFRENDQRATDRE